jgi:hypothetical protein
MAPSSSNPLRRAYQRLTQWVERTPERALDQAYDAILMIRAMEDEHFGGQKIGPSNKSESVQSYFEAELAKYLRIARVRLQEFRTSEAFLNLSDRKALGFDSETYRTSESDRTATLLGKLEFIDGVIEGYRNREASMPASSALIPITALDPLSPKVARVAAQSPSPEQSLANNPGNPNPNAATPNRPNKRMVNQTSFVPRSLLGTFDRIRQDLDPQAEQQMVQTFRQSKAKTVLSIRFLLILVLVPLLVHHLSKAIVVGPLVEHFRGDHFETLFVNEELEVEALEELERYERHLKFQQFVSAAPLLNAEETETKLKEKAEEIANSFRSLSSNAIKNVFADALAGIAVLLILLLSRRDIEMLKGFLDEVVYGLSDSAKAFILILLTDIFVGFHSPHGWEIILEGMARHFGLPESRSFIFLFIATFPVILDTVFKYWIFRYLNRISPSAVATYKNMNE